MPAKRNRPLRLERLEDRTMLSGVPQEVVVMSENLYMGADPVPIIAASVLGNNIWGGPALTLAVTDFWNNVKATDFNKRATAIAQQIADNKPDLIGLQEVMTYYSGKADSLFGNPTKASKVELDFLQVLQNKLAAKGLKYKAFSQPLGDFEAPGFIDGKLQDLRLVDSMVILARNDLPTSQVSYVSPQGGDFLEAVTFPQSLIGPITVHRGWNSIDVNWGQTDFRFVNMCLETPVFQLTQAMQGMEILLGPAMTAKPVILVGDSNSNGANLGQLANTLTYSMLTADYDFLLPGFTFYDAWTQTHKPSEPGYTWGNQPDLKNVQPMSYQPLGLGPYRMDLVLHQAAFQATSMKLVGVDSQTRADLGMWPSDHAGVVATLAIKTQTSSATNYEAAEFFADPGTSQDIFCELLASVCAPRLASAESELPELTSDSELASLMAHVTTTVQCLEGAVGRSISDEPIDAASLANQVAQLLERELVDIPLGRLLGGAEVELLARER